MKTLTRPQWVIIGLFAVFMLPILVALVLNLPGVRWMPFGLRNHGELLQPPPRLDALPVSAIDGGDLGDTPLGDTWTILVTAPAPCTEACEQVLEKAQRARIALGENGGRTRLLWLVSRERPSLAELERLAARFPALRVGATDAGSLPDELRGEPGASGAYVVDPRAFLILRYAPGFDGRDLLRDLERLLRYTEDG